MFAKDASQKFKARALIVVIIGFITMYFSGCFGTDIINVAQDPIMEKLGISATQAVLGWTIGGYTVIFLAFLFSTIIMKRGTRGFATITFFIMAIGAVLVGIGYSIGGETGSMLIIIGGFLLKNFLQGLQLSVFQVIANWFNKTRGFILGLMGASFALDNATSSTGLTLLYNRLGFNGMMLTAAVIMSVLGILNFLFVRTTPEECGLTTDGIETESKENVLENASGSFKSKWTLGRLLRVKESWTIMLGIGIFNMTLTAVVSQFFNSLIGMGVSTSDCMLYMMIFGLLGIVMAPVYGKLVDRIGAPKTGVVIAVLYICSVAGFAFHIPFLGALGLTFFVGAPVLQPALTIHVFGAREYQAVNRHLAIIVNLIAACGIPFMTICFDLTGSYTLAHFLLLAFNVIVLILMSICRNTYENGPKQ